MASVFISYRRGDSAGYAGRLHEALEERLGRGVVFRDVDTIQPGQDFSRAIDDRLRDCAVLLAVIGREWLDVREADGTRRLDSSSDYVRLEIAAALARADVLVIPVLVEGATMPRADQMPEVLRPLVQRQAVALYDEDWNAGVDRLTAAIRKRGVGTAPERAAAHPRALVVRRAWRVALPVLALVIAALGWLLFGRASRIADRESTVQSGNRPDRTEDERANAPAHDVAIPRICEVVDGDLVYSVIAASVTARGADQEVRVRIRAANDGRYDANFWDATFRLVLPDGAAVAPHSGLNDIAASHSVRDAVVAFTIPAGTTRASLRIAARAGPGEIPLVFVPGAGARPARDEHADAGDVLARAIVRRVVSEPRPLVSSGGLQVTLTRVVARQFANATRLIVSIRYSNRSGYAVGTTGLTLRAAVRDQVLAPVSAPAEVIENAADASGDFVFDLPPGAASATLRAALQNASATVPLEL